MFVYGILAIQLACVGWALGTLVHEAERPVRIAAWRRGHPNAVERRGVHCDRHCGR